MRVDRWLYPLALVALSASLVGTIWVVPYLPTNDGPEAVLAVHMENHFRDPGILYPSVFAPAAQFAGRGFTVLFEPLEEWLGWQRGLQVALSVIVLFEAWGVVAFLRALEPRRSPVALLAFPLALSWTLYMGMFPFSLALGVGMLVLAFALRTRDPTPGPRAVVAALLLLVAFLHMFAAVVCGLVLLAAAVARARRGARGVEALRVALTGVPAAGLCVAAVLIAHHGAIDDTFAKTFQFRPIREVLAVWPRTLVPGPSGRAFVVTAGVVACALVVGRRIFRPGTAAIDRALAALGIAFIVASIVAPRDIPGWQFFAQRFVWIGVILVLATLPVERFSPRVVTGLAFAAAFSWLSLSYAFHRRLAAASADAIAGLSAPVRRRGVWLPVTLAPSPRATDGEVPYQDPPHHYPALYAAALGGLTPYTFASNPASWPFVLRPDAVPPPPVPSLEEYMALRATPELQTNAAFRHTQENVLATFGMYYEGILVTGARPDDLALFQRRGYVVEWAQGSAMLAHFEPCRIEVTLPRDAPAPRIDVGVGATMMLREQRIAPVAGDDARARFVVDHGPCGRVWVRPHWDAPAPDGAPRTVYCRNAGPTGQVEGVVTRSRGVVDCEGPGS